MLHIGTAVQDLARLYPWLDEEATSLGLPKSMLYGMHVALEEAVMNVAMHAFQPGDPGDINVTLQRFADAAVLMIEDSGHAFDPTRIATSARPASLADTEPGGMGLNLLRHYCRDISYERVLDCNRLTLRFPVLQSPPQPPIDR